MNFEVGPVRGCCAARPPAAVFELSGETLASAPGRQPDQKWRWTATPPLSRWSRYLAPIYNTKWVVYAKRPFAGPAQVLDYVGRYTHRVAISNNRLVSMDDGTVRFRWRITATTTATRR